MPAELLDTSTPLPVRADWIDLPTRLRIIAHLQRYLDEARASDPGFSQRQLAKKLGINQGYLSKVMAGVRLPGLDLVLRINRKLYISADVLLNHDPPPSKVKHPH